MRPRRKVENGEPIPARYGAAWFDYWRRASVYCPVPLNWLVRWGRELYFRLQMARHASTSEKLDFEATEQARRQRERLAEQYASGYVDGWTKCYDDVMEAVRQELEAAYARRNAGHKFN